jgi:hypothetical protein
MELYSNGCGAVGRPILCILEFTRILLAIQSQTARLNSPVLQLDRIIELFDLVDALYLGIFSSP